MFSQLLAIARNTFVESVRQPIFFVLVGVSGILQIFNSLLSTYSMGYTDTTEVTGDDKLFLDIGLATVLFCATLLASFVATAVISREIEQKTALTVISKPVGRPLFVLGKYLGVAGAVSAAVALMMAFFLLALQHGVMSRAWDSFDRPVLILGVGSALLAVAVATWGNYFYGWVFSSAAVYLMVPLVLLALVATLAFGPDWKAHASLAEVMTKEVKPTILTACAGVALAMLVLTAVAVACSTRLGQVMTIVVCFGVFLFGLLSNHLVGRYAYRNSAAETIGALEAQNDPDLDFRDAGDVWLIRLKGEPRTTFKPGDSLYYASDPSGVEMHVPRHPRFTGDVNSVTDVNQPGSGPAVVVRAVEGRGKDLIVVNAGGLATRSRPYLGDYVFAGPTRVNWLARVVWGVTPNVQFFWLVDAVTQGHTVPLRYAGLLVVYSACQITALLGLAVFLFQKREVG